MFRAQFPQVQFRIEEAPSAELDHKLLEGEIDQIIDGQVFRLGPGDSLHYTGQTPHSWANPTDRTARIQEVHLLTLHCLCDGIDCLLLGVEE